MNSKTSVTFLPLLTGLVLAGCSDYANRDLETGSGQIAGVGGTTSGGGPGPAGATGNGANVGTGGTSSTEGPPPIMGGLGTGGTGGSGAASSVDAGGTTDSGAGGPVVTTR